MTFGLFGTIICLTLFLLKRYTDVDIFEEEKAFITSSNAIPKIITVAKTNETASKTNKGIILNSSEKGKIDGNGAKINGAANANAMLLLNEVVTEATKATNKNNLQENSHQAD